MKKKELYTIVNYFKFNFLFLGINLISVFKMSVSCTSIYWYMYTGTCIYWYMYTYVHTKVKCLV